MKEEFLSITEMLWQPQPLSQWQGSTCQSCSSKLPQHSLHCTVTAFCCWSSRCAWSGVKVLGPHCFPPAPQVICFHTISPTLGILVTLFSVWMVFILTATKHDRVQDTSWHLYTMEPWELVLRSLFSLSLLLLGFVASQKSSPFSCVRSDLDFRQASVTYLLEFPNLGGQPQQHMLSSSCSSKAMCISIQR